MLYVLHKVNLTCNSNIYHVTTFNMNRHLYFPSDMFDLQINPVITIIIISYGTMIPMNKTYRDMRNYS